MRIPIVTYVVCFFLQVSALNRPGKRSGFAGFVYDDALDPCAIKGGDSCWLDEDDDNIVDVQLAPIAHDCSSCAYTIDLRHNMIYANKVWHATFDLLLPQYQAVVSAYPHSQEGVCAVVNGDTARMQEVLAALEPDLPLKFISKDAACVEKLQKNGVDKSTFTNPWHRTHHGKVQWEDWERHPEQNNLSVIPFGGLEANVQAMQKSAKRYKTLAGTEKYVVLILRGRYRRFDKITAQHIRIAVKSAGFNVVDYYGNISQPETMRLFGHAAGIVGFHGAGFVNTLFSQKKQCAIELTVFNDYKNTRLWRTAKSWLRINKLLKFEVFALSKQRMIDANSKIGAGEKTQHNAFHYWPHKDGAQKMDFAPRLTKKEAQSISIKLKECVAMTQ